MVRLETLKERYVIYCQINTLTALHIGKGRGEKEIGEADLPILKLPDGTPYIPGSSLKGIIRSHFERIVTGLGIRVCIYQKSQTPIIPDYECEPENPCISCELFGSKNMSSRVIVRDSYPREKVEGIIRKGIALNRDTKTVSPGRGPFDIEFVPPGTKFDLEIVIENPEEWMLGALFATLEDISNIGGQVSRGMGKVKIEIIKIESWTPDSIVKQRPANIFSDEALKKFIEETKKAFNESIHLLKDRYGGSQ